ncbi:hypothetical protein N2152v2_011244 [Parachlorella kessleri]
MTRLIKGIFFDLDDTLVLTKDVDAQAHQRVCQLGRQLMPGLDGQRLLADWRAVFGAQPWDPEHKVDVEEWRAGLWRQAVNRQGLECGNEAAAQLQACWTTSRLELFRFVPGVDELITSLAAAGYQMVIITNGHHLIQRQKVASCEATRLFTHILVGGEEIRAGRHEKPHPSIFHRACELAQCQPQDAIHIGDSLTCDVQGGIEAGLAATVWVNASGAPLPEGCPQPDYVVSSVLELPEVLKALEAGPVEADSGCSSGDGSPAAAGARRCGVAAGKGLTVAA